MRPLVVVTMLLLSAQVVADDTMKSLFLFQQQMAKSGSVEAWMKLGRMYEEGQGTPRDLNKAIEMYQHAAAKGHTGAKEAIRQLKLKRRKASAEAQRKRQADIRAKQEQARRAEQQRLVAKEKARQQALAEQKQREQARRNAAANKAAKLRAQKLAEQQRRQKQRAYEAALARQRDRQKAEAQARKASVEEQGSSHHADKPVAEQASAQDDEQFKSDPCKTAAARLLTICKGKQ